MQIWWRIEMFGGLAVRSADTTISRFYSQKVGHLLAYLALNMNRQHPREELAELFWPDADASAGRLNLRVGIASLRRQLEPPGLPNCSVLIASRNTLSLNPLHVTTDVAEFQAAIRAADIERDVSARLNLLENAAGLAVGDLTPGCYEEWIIGERNRISDLRISTLIRLLFEYEQLGDIARAIDCSHRLLAIDPLNEQAHYKLIDLHIKTAQPEAAIRQYRELERVLQESFGETPSADVTALVEKLGHMHASTPKLKQAVISSSALSTSEVVAPSAVYTSPKSEPAVRLPTIPSISTRFFGREIELAEIVSLLDQSWSYSATANDNIANTNARIVTITGPGGVGKTRLALEAAYRISAGFTGHIVFVPLAGVVDPAGIPDAILSACPVNRNANLNASLQIVGYLSGSPSLVILDNFEQLLSEGAKARKSVEQVLNLRDQCPHLTLLVTSRQALNVQFEHEAALQPLPTPLHPGLPERLLEFAGVQLFVDRAQAARADFQITPRNSADIALVCSRLEGIPLALELAAAWARVLVPGQMVDRLSSRFEMLVSRKRDVADRHRSLRAAIDWSYRLLPADLQECFTALSVFRGGWTLEAAKHVCGVEDVDARLLTLIESSMVVQQETEAGTMRFYLLDSLREFAEEQTSAENRDCLRNLHADYFAHVSIMASERYGLADAAIWMDTLESEIDNLRSALDWSLAQTDMLAGVKIAMHLDWFWFTRGYHKDRLMRVEQVRSGLHLLGPFRPKAAIWIAAFVEPEEAQKLHAECLRLFKAAEDEVGIADTLYRLGSSHVLATNYVKGAKLYRAALEINRRVGSRGAIDATMAALAHVLKQQGDYRNAVTLLQELLQAHIEHGAADGAAKIQIGLANIYIDQGKYVEAETFLSASMAAYRAIGQRWGYADCLRNVGNLRCSLGLYSDGEAFLKESLGTFQSIDDEEMIGNLQIDLAEAAWHRLDDESLAVRLSDCQTHFDSAKVGYGVARLKLLQGRYALAWSTDCAKLYMQEAAALFPQHATNSFGVALNSGLALLAIQEQDASSSCTALTCALKNAGRMELKPQISRLLLIAAQWCLLNEKFESCSLLLARTAELSSHPNPPLSPRDAASYSQTNCMLPESLHLQSNSRKLKQAKTNASALQSAIKFALITLR